MPCCHEKPGRQRPVVGGKQKLATALWSCAPQPPPPPLPSHHRRPAPANFAMHAFKKARRGGVKGKKELQAGAKLKRGKKRVLSAEAERAPDHVVLEVGDRTGVPREDNLHCPVGCISCILATAAVLGLLWNLRSFVDTIDDNLGGAFQAGVCTVNGFEGPRPKEPSLATSNLMSPPPPVGTPSTSPSATSRTPPPRTHTAPQNGEARRPKFLQRRRTGQRTRVHSFRAVVPRRRAPRRHLNVTFEDGRQPERRDLGAVDVNDARPRRRARISSRGRVTFTAGGGRRPTTRRGPPAPSPSGSAWPAAAAGEGSAVSEAQLAAAFREYVYDPRGLSCGWRPTASPSTIARRPTALPLRGRVVPRRAAARRRPAPPRSPPHRARPPPRAAPCSVLGGPRMARRRSPRSSRCTPRGRRRRATATTRAGRRREQPTQARGGGGVAANKLASSRRLRSTGWGLLPRRRRDAAVLRLLLLPLLLVVVPQRGKIRMLSISDERRV